MSKRVSRVCKWCGHRVTFDVEKHDKHIYNKALDDFMKFASDMPTVETEDGTIRPMWLEEMAEHLKEKYYGQRSDGNDKRRNNRWVRNIHSW